MKVFLGFSPDTEANSKIRKTVAEVGKVFDAFDIPVRWDNPNTYHLSVVNFGGKLPIYRYLWLRYKLKNFKIYPFKITFSKIRLGISGKYKELVFLDLKEGGEEMRAILYELRKCLNMKDVGNFVPHLELGRVSKDMGNQEYANLSRDLYRVSKELRISNISFFVNSLKLIKNDSGNSEFLLEFGRSC